MKFAFVLALAAVIAVVSADVFCEYNPPTRKCKWSVKFTFKTDNGVSRIYKYYVDGRYKAKEVYNGDKP